jgi:hypothetical protein
MKKLPVSTQLLKLCFLFILILKGNAIFSQVVPEIIFKNPVLESGSYGQDGAKYRFSNVAPGIDAVLEIRGRSSASVVMSSVDTSGPGLGYDNALQPVVGIPGVAPANSTWSINLRIIFYDAGTTHKAKIPKIKLTGLDIDGDGLTLSEWTEMDMVSSIDTSNINSLNFSTLSTGGDGNNYKVSGTIANATDIDTSATNVMATYN